jgi:septum formation protein
MGFVVATRRRLVLASASPARKRLLEQAGFAFEVHVSDVDETVAEGLDVGRMVHELAVRKAEAVAPAHDDALVIGCDSLLDVDGAAHGKPASAEQAIERLRGLRGGEAVLRTGHCIIDTAVGRRATGVASTVVHFGDFTDAELAAYVASDGALATAGAFTLEGRSAPFIDGIDGDPSNVIGLSLPLFRSLLGDLGVSVVDLWR